MNIYGEARRNRRTTGIFITLFIAFFLLCGLGLDRYYGAGLSRPFFTAAALAFASLSSWGAYRAGDRLVLAATGARRADPSVPDEKRWQDVVEEAAIAGGVPAPAVYVVDDPAPNAFAAGLGPGRASIAATSGLLHSLGREELLGVAGHEISHVRNYDVRLMLVVTVLAGSVVMLADWAVRSLFWSRGRRDRREGGGELIALAFWLAAVILAPLLARLMALFIGRTREYLADASGAQLTRDPLALASGLEKISSWQGPSRSYSRGSAYLWIGEPARVRRSTLFATHPPVRERIARLRAMAYAGAR